jgi:hypothetical protein
MFHTRLFLIALSFAAMVVLFPDTSAGRGLLFLVAAGVATALLVTMPVPEVADSDDDTED